MPDNITKDWTRTLADEIAVTKHGCYFDKEAADRVVTFMGTFIKHVKGPLAKEPYKPLEWHKNDIIYPIFGWKMPDGTRRHNQFDCFVPKKNAKSTLAAAIKLYMLCADNEQGAEVYSAAGDKKQASIVYEVAYHMVKESPELSECIELRKSQKLMRFNETNSKYQVLTSDGSRNEGYDIHCVGIDELHTQKNRQLWGALRYGGASRRQPLVFTISTAGELDEDSLWWERFQIAKNRDNPDIHYRGIVYAIADDEDWEDEEIWKKVNPGWGVTINPTLFHKDYRDAKLNGANEAEFLRYHLNRATRAETTWLRRHYWTACFDDYKPEVDAEDEVLPESVFGIDIADSIDLNAAIEAVNVIHPTKGPCVKIIPTFWAPSEAGLTQNKGNRDRYLKWFEDGHLRSIEGPIVPHLVLAKEVAELIKSSPYKVLELGCDRYQGTQFCTHLVEALQVAKKRVPDKFIRMVPYNCPSMNEPTKYLENLIVSGKLIVPNHPILNWMFNNVKTLTDSSGNRKLDKTSEGGAGKIDGFAATCIALYISIHIQNERLKKRSKYNDESESIGTMWWGASE